jgi:predicted DCC family thiol-disulfide oxidoreductase YuxK
MFGQESLPVLVYDGDCAFCSSSVRFIRNRIRRHPRCAPWQGLDLDLCFDRFGLTRDDFEKSVQFIDADGSVHSAERAVARVLIHGGTGWALMGRVLLVPVVRRCAGLVYRWIANNRHRMPGGTPQCSMPSEERVVSSGRSS